MSRPAVGDPVPTFEMTADDRIENANSDLHRHLGEEHKRLLPLLEAGNFAEVRASLARADALRDEPTLRDLFRADIAATTDRDPAADRCIEPLLYFKGFHAIQTHRLAHWLWNKGRQDFAFYLQSRASAVGSTKTSATAKARCGASSSTSSARTSCVSTARWA